MICLPQNPLSVKPPSSQPQDPKAMEKKQAIVSNWQLQTKLEIQPGYNFSKNHPDLVHHARRSDWVI